MAVMLNRNGVVRRLFAGLMTGLIVALFAVAPVAAEEVEVTISQIEECGGSVEVTESGEVVCDC